MTPTSGMTGRSIRLTWVQPEDLVGHELRQAVFNSEVLAVRRGVLADQINFTNTVREQACGLDYDRFEASASKFTAILRDHAEGTGMVTSFSDFDVGEVASRGEHARC